MLLEKDEKDRIESTPYPEILSYEGYIRDFATGYDRDLYRCRYKSGFGNYYNFW